MNKQHSLAELRPGQRIRIEHILFEALREHCLKRGLHEGDAVSGAAGGPEPEGGEGPEARVQEAAPPGRQDTIMVLTADGRLVPCERDWARFVQVQHCILR